MQPRALDQILAELNPIYQPQVDLYRQRQADIPGQIASEEAGLEAKKNVAFDSILGGARQRGLGFSGIPLGEQAKYTATDYLPAVAKLRQSGRQQAQSLEEALLGINERKQTAAMGMRQYEQQRYDQHMEQLRREEEARRQQAEAQRAAGAGAFAPTMGGGAMPGKAVAGAATPPKIHPLQQDAFNDVNSRIQSGLNPQQLMSDYLATASSARNGNQRDLYKLQIYRALRPDLFKTVYPWEASGGKYGQTANSGSLRF